MRGGVQLTIGPALLLLLVLSAATAHRCDRTPEGHVSPKIPADNRFQLKISGSPEKYVPGEGYTISLQGLRNHGQVAQKFTGFTLMVEAQDHSPLRVLSLRDVTERPVGIFQLYGDTLTKFSATCPNMVTHTSSMPKSEVQVRWTAPPPGSGCVIFRATVIEHRDVWYQDDGPLSKMLCEEEQESLDSQPEILETCCACDEAKYEVTFEGLWSRHTHPKDFPSNSWLTRFSDVIGASHSTHYRFWEYGGVASDGLRNVAERGSTRVLETELKGQSQNIRTIIKARGISYPNITGKTFAVFRVDKVHHLMSLVSMIDPSPDWIVGVSALELCLRNCSWIESRVLNLYPWDAGTDSGITYISPDQHTYPRDKIRRITSSFPNDPRSPFYDSSGVEMKPLAKLYLTRQRLYEKTCDDEPAGSNECAMSDWSDWGPCSASCGPGWKHRQRHYKYRKHNRKNCPHLRLTEKKSCVESRCRFQASPTQEPHDPHCEVKHWADWSRCLPVDQTCTRGTQKRYRTVRPHDSNKRKYCLSIPQEEERECRPSMSPSVCPKNGQGKVSYKDPQSSTCCAENTTENEEYDIYGEPKENEGEDPTEENNENKNETYDANFNDNEYPDREDNENHKEDDGNNYEAMEEPVGECAMTKWSEWSPCSVSCGVGETRRLRSLLNPPEDVPEPRAEYRRYRRSEDPDYGAYDDNEPAEGSEGQSTGEYAEGPCSIYKIEDVMPCNGTYGETCQFSPEDSRATDENQEEETTEEPPENDLQLRSQLIDEGTERPVRDCKFSRWSEWSKCEAPCNQHGYKVRTRFIQVHARNGGKDCNGKTRKQRKCFRKCKPNEENEDEEEERSKDDNHRNHSRCEYSDWSEWTECTSTCGYSSMRQRTRQVSSGDPAECNDRIRTRQCNVGPCPH